MFNLNAKLDPYPYQKAILDRILAVEAGGKLFVTSPTGSGKSVMTLMAHRLTLPNSVLLTPRIEIIDGFMEKIEGGDRLAPEDLNIFTPITFLNHLKAGRFDTTNITHLYKDEAHHDEATTYKKIDACFPDTTRHIGFSANYFRGTPKGTLALRESWPNQAAALTYPEAVAQGFISLPKVEVLPLVDDDILEISGGEFVVSTVNRAVGSKLEDCLIQCKERDVFNRPTLIGIPTSEMIEFMKLTAEKLNIPVWPITAETSRRERRQAFQAALACTHALVHINTVSEGVDLRLAHYIDLNPTMSPVLWQQRIGRIMRPGVNGMYICTNRNLERHAYTLEGIIPTPTISEAQAAFGGPSERNGARVFGIESLGKIRPTDFILSGGLRCSAYCVSQMQGIKRMQYLCVLHPGHANPIWFNKISVGTEWGKWTKAKAPDVLQGCRSESPRTLTEKQDNLFRQKATLVGLDPQQKMDARRIQVFFALLENRMRIQ